MMNRELKVGLFFALSLGILLVSIFYIGNFQENLSYQIRFPEVNGLQIDSPVLFSGVPVGRVTRIRLSEEPAEDNHVEVLVQIGVHRSVRKHIRQSTTADIKSRGVLGDKYILLNTADYQAEPLELKGFIRPAPQLLNMSELLRQGSDLFGDVTDMSENLRRLIAQLANQKGLLQRLIGDEALAETTTKALSEVLTRIETGESFLGMLLNDEAFGRKARTDLESALGGLAKTLEQLQGDQGLLAMLLHDEPFKEGVRQQLNSVLESAGALMERYRQAEGLLPKLMEDEEYGARIAANLDKASFHLASILEKVDKGEGSAGLLLNDPAIYQGLYEVVYGLKNSGLSKWYIQSKQKKGHKLIESSK
jgi:phospholipid/cholesterol/gamma-HCH transport system substrate-binding protein